MSGRLARDNPDLVRRFRTALLQGLEYARSVPAEAARVLAGIVPTTNADTAAAELALMRPYVGTQPLGSIDPARIGRAIEILEGTGAIPPGLTPGRLVAFDLTPGGFGR